eukprot:87988-Alexandrium_andersonii.AAC.1
MLSSDASSLWRWIALGPLVLVDILAGPRLPFAATGRSSQRTLSSLALRLVCGSNSLRGFQLR